MRKWFMSPVFFGLLLSFSAVNLFVHQNPARSENNPSFTAGSTGTDSVSQKLDKISDTQSQILRELEEIKEELQIVKIRASQK